MTPLRPGRRQKSSQKVKLIFEMTNLCNFSCIHCIRDEEGPKHYLPLAIVDKVLSETEAYQSIHVVALTGGEPTLHPEFGAIVERIVAQGLPFCFVTNGSRFDKTYRSIEAVKPWVRNINFSLDGASEEIHDALRRRPGSFREIMAAISRCHFQGIPVHVNMVVTTANQHQLQDMAVLASQLGGEALGFGHCQPTPDGVAAGLVLDVESRRKVESEVARLQQMFQLDIAMAGDHYDPSPFYQCPQLQMQEFNIDYRGRLTACCTLSNYRGGVEETDVIADLAETSFFEAHRRLLAKITEINSEKLERLADGDRDEADHFICTHCLEHYRKVGDVSATLATPGLVQLGSTAGRSDR